MSEWTTKKTIPTQDAELVDIEYAEVDEALHQVGIKYAEVDEALHQSAIFISDKGGVVFLVNGRQGVEVCA